MARPQPFTLIDTRREGSVSFAPPDPTDPEARGSTAGGHATAPVGTGRLVGTSGLLGGASRDGVSGYPIQVGKVQRPPLREETLARHRLLDWLDVKIHNRVVFVIADAGYGKTTLLADFSRRTRLRTLWYRMDEEDRNWVTFLSYLVAAGREHDPEFAPRTWALLQDTGPGGPNRDEAVATFLRELPEIAPTPTVLILDDFHVTDGSGDVSYVARNLVAKAPERLTVVISSRRVPEIPVGRLRAQGELAELRTRDLQFSEAEISDLFNAGQQESLDHESLSALNRRSEGWAASLELIRTAIRDRSAPEVREFIRNLSGDQAELYDYLAEEVVGDLRHDHQTFLMRTSLLQVVSAPAAAAVCGVGTSDASRLVEQSERLGLLSRQGATGGGFRYHPLVREFLEARLVAAIGVAGVQGLHQSVGDWAVGVDWRAACYHYDLAGNVDALHGVLRDAIDNIAGQGGYEDAARYLRTHEPTTAAASFEIIESRMEYWRGNFEQAIRHANAAVDLEPNLDAALSNSIALHGNVGNHAESFASAKRLAESASSPMYRTIARATCLMYEVSLDGDLVEEIDFLSGLAAHAESDSLTQFSGVGHLNISLAEHARGAPDAAFSHADMAVNALAQTFQGAELAAAYLSRALAMAKRGSLERARVDIAAASEAAPGAARGEWLVEAADVEAWFGSRDLADSLLAEAEGLGLSRSLKNLAQTVKVRLALRAGDGDRACELADTFEVGLPTDQPGFKSRQLAIVAHAAVASGSDEAQSLVNHAVGQAKAQNSQTWLRYCQILGALLTPGSSGIGPLVQRTPDSHLWTLDAFAELICADLEHFNEATRQRLAAHSASRSERWLPALRLAVTDQRPQSRWAAGELLDLVGSVEDIPTLRALAKSSRGSSRRVALGRSLARRLAPRFLIDDLGRVEVRSGEEVVPGSAIRRKVLAMLCFLLTRPRFAATRDEVIDALWPDLSPDVAVNSLNQTVYFLRRVFEPGYVDDLSPEYVHHGPDILWLDPELIASRSARCLALLDSLASDLDPESVDRLSVDYTDRFALDFAYEEWAVPFRTSLHVAYLRVVEAAVTRDMASGHHDRAIGLARRALERDPAVESLELALLRLYRTTGAHSAAAEQYEHYSAFLRDELGVEPPPLTSL